MSFLSVSGGSLANISEKEITDLINSVSEEPTQPRELTRSTRSTQSRRAKADPKKDWVYQIYTHSSKIKIDMKLNKIATLIRKEFARLREGGNPQIPPEIALPGVDSIKGYLKSNPDVWREFQKEERF